MHFDEKQDDAPRVTVSNFPLLSADPNVPGRENETQRFAMRAGVFSRTLPLYINGARDCSSWSTNKPLRYAFLPWLKPERWKHRASKREQSDRCRWRRKPPASHAWFSPQPWLLACDLSERRGLRAWLASLASFGISLSIWDIEGSASFSFSCYVNSFIWVHGIGLDF